ncbi:MAG: hypothetical protein JHC78_04825 [Ilumatobacteraceae bacterium]|nr:hypothetical protein [Ilumatobacteraceae bacterium]MBJ7367861.1 hypothetical protein [Ilumatobacteraceae bacterium]MBJ7490074.1 hypothetical protein [Ilumatobacteraceae bacterium]
MNSLDTFVQVAVAHANEYEKCSPEQALTYASEDIVDNELGSRNFSSHHIEQWLQHVCTREDIDMPQVVVGRAARSSLGSADIESHTICLRGKKTTAATALHEVAHVIVGADSHGVLFRDELVRLARAHISVDYAALLHGVYQGVGLEMSPWPASASRR